MSENAATAAASRTAAPIASDDKRCLMMLAAVLTIPIGVLTSCATPATICASARYFSNSISVLADALRQLVPQQILGGGAHHLDKVCEHGRKQRRRARNGRQEISAAQHEQLAGRDRFGGGIASTAVEQGEFTERVAGTRTSELNFAAILQRPAQSNRAGENAVQRVAWLALPKDDFAPASTNTACPASATVRSSSSAMVANSGVVETTVRAGVSAAAGGRARRTCIGWSIHRHRDRSA